MNVLSLNLFTLSSSGTLPPGIANMTNLTFIDISNNFLHGSAQVFNGLENLETLFLGSNLLSGLVPAPNSKSLQYVDLSYNVFTGSLPSESFMSPALILFSASSNCLLSELPQSLCSSMKLSELYINGLGSNDRCTEYQSSAQNIARSLVFPQLISCIWSTSSISKLYLAGNSYSGKLDEFDLPNITELGLGSNRLYGRVPVTLNGKHMDYFDISSNRFSNTLENINIYSSSQNSTFKAQINRLSGPIPTDPLLSFSRIDILNGNIISCSTIPSTDPFSPLYKCGSSELESALYFWLVCLLLSGIAWRACLYFTPRIAQRVQDEYLARSIMSSSENRIAYPRTLNFLHSLARLVYMIVAITLITLLLQVLVISPLKFDSGLNGFSTRSYQYQNQFSGLFLKTSVPAFVIAILHFIVTVLLIGAYFMVYVRDWGIMRLGNSHANLKTNSRSTFNWVNLLLRSLATVIYIMISFFVNILYVFLTSDVGRVELFFLQLMLQISNFILQVSISPFVNYLFSDKWETSSNDDTFAGQVIVILLTFIDTVTPFVATVVGDDRCFNDLVVSYKDTLTVAFEHTACLMKYINDECIESVNVVRSVPYSTSFIYSGECRDAVMLNYLPVIIISSAFIGFIYPILHTIVTINYSDLDAPISIFGSLNIGTLKSLLLTDHRMRVKMGMIWTNQLLFLTYGIMSPYATAAIGVSTVLQIMFLRANICRYFHLQQRAGANNGNVKTNEMDEVESICRKSQITVHAMLWPGVTISSIIFSLIVFDMACDTDKSKIHLAIPFIVLSMTLGIIPITRTVFYHYKRKLEFERDQKQMHQIETIEIAKDDIVSNPLTN